MRILVLFRKVPGMRKALSDHIYSFQKYGEGVEVFNCDFFFRYPFFLHWIHWDGIIVHYSLLAERWDLALWKYHRKQISKIGKLRGFKVAIPQDEYSRIPELQDIFKRCGIDTVYTCLFPADFDKIYPLEKTGLKHRFSTFTGFVDDATWPTIQRLSSEIKQRDIDIGYRARNLPFWLGKHGQLKKRIADEILQAPNEQNLKLDISNEEKDVFYGEDWIRFLLRCRCVVGCLGGASLYDPDGNIRKQVEDFVQKNPKASFEEVESKCFPGKDDSLGLFALSPRHFECAMTKTCQVLVEGDYQGIFIPGRHYIELKKDFSNLTEVFEKVADSKYCEQIAENAFCEIAKSGKYTYKVFVNLVLRHVQECSQKPENGYFKLLMFGVLMKMYTALSFARTGFFKAWMKWRIVCSIVKRSL